MSNAVKGWLTLLLILLAVYGSFSLWRVTRTLGAAGAAARLDAARLDAEPTPVGAKPERPLADLTFTERSGKPFALKELEGKIWVANTFFASCPGFCLQMNREVAAIANDLADADVTFVSITVDPDADTPAVLRTYANGLEADAKKWLFLRGEPADLRDLVEGRLKLPAAKEHSEKLALVGRDGKVLGWYRSSDPSHVEKLKAKIREMAAQTVPGEKPAAGGDSGPAADKETP